MFSTAFSQENQYHSIQEALNHHIEQLKANVRHYDNVFVITKLEDDTALPEKALKVENGLDAKSLKKEDQNFLVEIKIETKVNYLKINITNYRVVKLSNKKLKLLNLSNGQTYIVK